MNRKLFVGNIPFETTEAELQELFAKTGQVESVRVMRDRETGRARGFAFVEMATEADASNAIAQLNEQPFGGRALAVNEARPQPARAGGFGGRDNRGPRGRSEPRW
jgi:RNA recognition motif-containing protein